MQRGGDRVITVIKTLGIRNASLHVITAGKRKALARFEGKIEIREEQNMVPVLGRACKGEKKIYASFVLCENIDYCLQDEYSSGKVYEVLGDVEGSERLERLLFSGLRFEDIDPLTGTVMLEITDMALICKMLAM